MKEGWTTKTLGEVCDIERGGSPRPIDSYITTAEDGINWIKIGDTKSVTKYITKTEEKIRPEGAKRSRMVFEGDFLLSNSMSFGRPYIMKTTGCIHDGWLVLRQPKVDQDYLYHVLGSDLVFSQFDRLAAGSTVRNLNIGLVKGVQIPVPPLLEQRRIVGILDETFEGIATAKANAEKNLQNARAIFESHLHSVFTERGVGWVRTTIGDQVLLQRGFDITKDGQNAGDVPVVSSGGIKSFHDKAMVQGPGVVIGRKGTLGKVFYLESDFWPHDTTLWVSDFKGNDPRFVYYFFIGLDVRPLDSGTANPALNRNQVHPIEVDWPPLFQERAIVATLDALSDETQRLEALYRRKLAAVEALRKSLLHQAFTGQL